MKSITLGLALSLLGGAALGQTPPAPPRPPALNQPAAGPGPTPSAPQPSMPQPSMPQPPAPQAQQNAQNGQPAVPPPGGPPEGMVVETPNGFYLVRPGDPNPQRIDMGRNAAAGQPGMGQPGMGRPIMGQNGPAAMMDGDDPMGEMAEGGMRPRPPRPHGPPPHMAEGKGARLHIHAPNLDVDVKCPDDEPIKACVDAISQLMDKANTAAH